MISFNKAKVGLLKTFGWKRVGIIYDYTQTLFFQVRFKSKVISILTNLSRRHSNKVFGV